MSDAPRFVVHRLNWRQAGGGFVRLPGGTRVAAFHTFEEADLDRALREEEVRARVNPFKCGTTWHALTTLPQPIFLDWLQDGGLLPMEAWTTRAADNISLRAWAEWWQRIGHTLTAEQTAHLWEGLNHVRFFDVIERTASQVAFAVVRVMWEYNGSWYEPGEEGGRTVRAFRSRECAEAERERLEADARCGWHANVRLSARRWKLEEWPTLGDGVGTECDEALDRIGVPLYEVVEIDLGGEMS